MAATATAVANAAYHIDAAKAKNGNLAVLMIQVRDVDRLYASAGHLAAGRRIAHLQERFAGLARPGDLLLPIGDRKFAMVLAGLRNRGHVQLAAQKILRIVEQDAANSAELTLRVNIGIAIATDPQEDSHRLLQAAEIALVNGRRGNHAVAFHELKDDARLLSEWNLEQRLGDALEAGDLELHYQPKVSLLGSNHVDAEALMRWHDAEHGPIPPDTFIAVAELCGLIGDLTYFSVQRACRQLSLWTEAPAPCIAVNISPHIARNPELIDVIESATGIWGVEASRLVFEVTENALMADPEACHDVLMGIRELGARTSIDDFGTGYSSLAYLKNIPADELKIDRTFVMNMLDDEGDRKIVEHAISIARSFGLSVVAEGVENEATLEALRELGCEFAQGYHISKPLTADDFAEWVRARDAGNG